MTNQPLKASQYPLDTLEDELDVSDFAIAIAQPDDMLKIRGQEKPVPRDNAIFEVGFFMGRLGRQRAILMEPRGDKATLPSDLAGITTIPNKYAKGRDLAAAMGPACNRLHNHVEELDAIS
jgi:CRP/FNR family cyclic AMP-dependent transcriptional regulator